MTDSNQVFNLFPDFIKNYIYRHRWEELREIQIAAAETILQTDHNLLLTSSTASGKTEAAFFPILSDLYRNPSSSVGVLYIAPLQALINDQFERIQELLDESGIPVTHWHGDVAKSHKQKLLEHPKGILQITPESLESLLMRKHNEIPALFGDLRYIILDEIHILSGSDRGNQMICQINRIDRIIHKSPRRIGLSATVGNPEQAALWLSAGSPRETDVPSIPPKKLHWKLGMEHFFIQQPGTEADEVPLEAESEENAEKPLPIDAGYEYMYDCVKNVKSLVFSNSREETEYLTATFRQIASRRGDPDIFLIHHGNLSAALREEAEQKMKDPDIRAVTCATVTMELGIDIGRLERVLQSEAPTSVSSFLQRLGRSGRRGEPPEMMMVFREEDEVPNTPLPDLIPWELIRGIAIVQLYVESRFIEPPSEKELPFSLLFHQTLSILASCGELTPAVLCERVLTLPPFRKVTKEDYRELIVDMIQNEFLEWTPEKTLIIGLKGEKIISSFRFFAVFKDTTDYTVRCGSDEIGTISNPLPVGDRFALAGRVWEVEELDIRHKLIYVKSVKGKMEVSWPGDYGEIHTRILERMWQVLKEDTVYPYLKPNARIRLEKARHVARNSGMTERMLIHLGGYTWCLFPWLGTRSFRTLRKVIKTQAQTLGISNLEFQGCEYMTFRMENGDEHAFAHRLMQVASQGIDTRMLVSPTESPVFEKFDPYIPGDLLRKAYARDRLRPDEAERRIQELFNQR